MANCPKCGKENPGYVFYCGGCGTEIPEDVRKATLQREKEEGERAAGAMPSSSHSATSGNRYSTHQGTSRTCHFCETDYDSSLEACPMCGRNLEEQLLRGARADGGLSSSSASSGLTVGGILAIIAGVLALGQGLIYVGGSSYLGYVPGSGILCTCGAVDVLFGLGSIAGGVFAIKRENYMLAIIGAVVGMLGAGLLLGFLLGLIALVLIASAKSEFRE